MSRSNGPLGQVRGSAPQQWQAAPEQDPAVQQAYAAAQARTTMPGRAPQSGFGHVQGQHPYPAQAHGYAPQQPAVDHGHYGAYAPAEPQQQPSYQPIFDRYAPPAEPARGYEPRQAVPRTQPPQPQPYAPVAAPAQTYAAPAYDAHAQLRGSSFDQWPPQQPVAQPAYQPPQARRANDFSNYMPAPAPVDDYARQASQSPQQQFQAQLQSARHAAAGGYAAPAPGHEEPQ